MATEGMGGDYKQRSRTTKRAAGPLDAWVWKGKKGGEGNFPGFVAGRRMRGEGRTGVLSRERWAVRSEEQHGPSPLACWRLLAAGGTGRLPTHLLTRSHMCVRACVRAGV